MPVTSNGWKTTGHGIPAFTETLKSATDLKIQQTNPAEPFEWSVNCACFETDYLDSPLKLAVWSLSCTADWSCVANNPDDDIVMTFALAGSLSFAFTDRTIELNVGEALVYRYNEEVGRHFRTSSGCCASISLKFSLHKARRIIARRRGRFHNGLTDFRHVVTNGACGFALIREMAKALADPAMTSNEVQLQNDTRHFIITTVVQLIFDVIPDLTKPSPAIDPGRAPPFVRKACQYILDHYADHLTVTQLAEQSAVSLRKLERGFRDGMGMTPTAYIKSVRLEAVRKELLNRNFKGSISAFAAKCGYTSRHRFREDYVTMYGETPKTTVAASRA